jgi:hypothetical protein
MYDNNSHTRNRKKILIGRAKKNQLTNEISGASGNDMENILVKTRFGGVPIRVAMPPMLALYAILNRRPIEYFLTFFFPMFFSRLIITESAIGTIIIAVAVFDTHIDKNHVVIMNPKRIFRGLVPNNIRVIKAIRRCKFHFSIARATIKPPIKRKITWLKYSAETSIPLIIPKRGNMATGKSAVIARGIASVIHQIAIRSATAAV